MPEPQTCTQQIEQMRLRSPVLMCIFWHDTTTSPEKQGNMPKPLTDIHSRNRNRQPKVWFRQTRIPKQPRLAVYFASPSIAKVLPAKNLSKYHGVIYTSTKEIDT
ncbi:hypothetical protein [Vogesella sp. EB]|uniref:hypothetical protein n=1 Tax=Vogesella sp. EB TaxID=1526735 RepID=UPI00138E1393|nr:hypothetical protein [Vogesella sp. EB]